MFILVHHQFQVKLLYFLLLVFVTGCSAQSPYVGINPVNPQFERGRPVPPLDIFSRMLSFPFQLVFWTNKYGNHQISEETEDVLAEFLQDYELTDVKVRLNQWAPHKEIVRLFKNKKLGWPYRVLFFPSTLLTSIIGRPLSGLFISDYYDPGSNTIHIFSDELSIALHEAGHAKDFAERHFTGGYAIARIIPGVDLGQEYIATDEALYYLESKGRFEEMFRGYKILYPAYATYVSNYFPTTPFTFVGAITIGHLFGRQRARMKKQDLIWQGKIQGIKTDPEVSAATPLTITQGQNSLLMTNEIEKKI